MAVWRRFRLPPCGGVQPMGQSPVRCVCHAICRFSHTARSYLANVHHRPFFSLLNFRAPFEGFHQAILQRILSIGLFYPISDAVRLYTEHSIVGAHPAVLSAAGGTIAGMFNALLVNPMSFVKYRSWGTRHRGEMAPTISHAFHSRGLPVFWRGIVPTIYRDVLWGATYNVLRLHTLPLLLAAHHTANPRPNTPIGTYGFTLNTAAALIATIAAAPFNYVRNKQYGQGYDRETRGVWAELRALWREAGRQCGWRGPYIASRLLVGWGTLRVAVGMGFASQVYGLCVADEEEQ